MPIHYESPEAIVRKKPLFASGLGYGSLELYRRTPDGPELIDKLSIENGFCEYQKSE